MPSNRIFMSSTESMRDAGLADIAHDARMVAVIAAMGGKIEGDRQPHLPAPQILAVEGVGILGGGEAGILPDGPRAVGIHRGARAAGIGARPGRVPSALEPFEIGLGIKRLEADAFRRLAGQASQVPAPFSSCAASFCQSARRLLRKIRHDPSSNPRSRLRFRSAAFWPR